MSAILDIKNLNKTYAGGFQALKNINLEIRKGEIFALLGPNGAGKTTLISSVCGIINPTSGTILVDGHDIIREFRLTRALIGLVPQELATDAFETVWDTVTFSRGLFGKPFDAHYIETVLKNLSLWDKKDNKIRTLSGGMKRRVMIAKALSHEPRLLFLDEPTAGVDVELRKDMWNHVRTLQRMGVTIILTTHYIDEAEEMADRIGIINNGELIITEQKSELMKKLGHKELILDFNEAIKEIPSELNKYSLTLNAEKTQLIYSFDSTIEDNGISSLLSVLNRNGHTYKDIHTKQSSLEDIFIKLVTRK
ncbi:MAG: ABC transporter ATP-binding protein [Candidatus Omnitrophica bacterium]|nr:ABC transporter ATP-binding protein [Candidatus Omnitrophota bacterium]